MSLERILFLDVDGVLNHAATVRRAERPGLAGWLDDTHLAPLNRVLAATNARIVVSSSWRVGRSLEDLRTLLGDFGVVAPIVDVTPVLPSRRRDEEILAWLAGHPEVAAHAVVDDELRVPERSPLAPHLVGTSMVDGLTDEHVGPLVARLSLPYRAPWRGVDAAQAAAFEAQLRREVSRRHILSGRQVVAVACRQDCDDVLFELDGGGASGALAVVHLTYARGEERESRYPVTSIYAARWRFEEQCMLPEAEDWGA